MTIVTMIGIVVIVVISILVYRVAVRAAFFKSSGNAGEANIYSAVTAAFLNLAAILLLERVYRQIAGRLSSCRLCLISNSPTYRMGKSPP